MQNVQKFVVENSVGQGEKREKLALKFIVLRQWVNLCKRAYKAQLPTLFLSTTMSLTIVKNVVDVVAFFLVFLTFSIWLF